MKVWDIISFARDKNLGKSYNETMSLIGDNDWCCLRDADTCFLSPDYGNILYMYALTYPNAALMTCYTNRVSPLSKMQLINGMVNNVTDIRYHISIAEKQKKYLYNTTPIKEAISGMLMLISKRAWKEQLFPETGQCLGVDTEYSRKLNEDGKPILRMEGLYLWHSYRLLNGINNKKHLA